MGDKTSLYHVLLLSNSVFEIFYVFPAIVKPETDTGMRVSASQCNHETLWKKPPDPEIGNLRYLWQKEKLLALLKRRANNGSEEKDSSLLFKSFSQWLGCENEGVKSRVGLPDGYLTPYDGYGQVRTTTQP